MKSIIEEMYNGDMFPLRTYSLDSKEYDSILGELVDSENALLHTYPEIKEMFDRYQDAQIRLTSFTNRSEFVNGVRVGAQSMLDMLKKIE